MKPGRIITIEPGDKIILKLEDQLIRGIKCTLTTNEIEYDELKTLVLGRRGGAQKEQRKKTPETKMSRQIQLLLRAHSTGYWTSGAPIERDVILAKLKKLLSNMSQLEANGLTPAAKQSLLLQTLPGDIKQLVEKLLS